MIVQVGEEYRTTFIKDFDIDIDDYKDWLGGEEPTEDNLLDYIGEMELEPKDIFEGNSDCLDFYIDDANNLFKELNDRQ